MIYNNVMIDAEQLVTELYQYDYDDNQVFYIYKGLKDELDVSIYADPKYNASQMEQLYLGLLHDIDVNVYRDPTIPSNRMKIIRISLENNTFSEDMLLPFITEREMVEISKSNKIALYSSREDYYKQYYKNKKLKEEIISVNEEELESIDFDNILEEDGIEDYYSEDFFIAKNDEPTIEDWEILNDYDYYYEHFNDINIANPYSEISKQFPLLSQKEELHYFEQYAKGSKYVSGWKLDEKSIKEDLHKSELGNHALSIKYIIFMSNIKLASSIASRYRSETIEFEDIQMVAFDGLERAIDSFDYKKGFKFSTYATWWIRQSVTRLLDDNERIIRIPVHVVERINKTLRFEEDFYEKNGYMPGNNDYKKMYDFDMNVETAEIIKQYKLQPLSIEELMIKDEESFLSSVKDGIYDPCENQNASYLIDELNKILSKLKEKEEDIIRLRFGMKDGRARSLEEVGNIYGVTRERIRQIEAKALIKLKDFKNRARLKVFLNKD